MQQRLTLSRQVFYFGLALMLGASVLSASVCPSGGIGVTLTVLTGAGMALAGRFCHKRLLRSARQVDSLSPS